MIRYQTSSVVRPSKCDSGKGMSVANSVRTKPRNTHATVMYLRSSVKWSVSKRRKGQS